MPQITTATLVCGPTRQRCYGYMNWIERICAVGWDVDGNGCWIWRGYLNRGRARISRGGARSVSPYRITYEAVHGPIPDGLYACHTCHNPACINPDHIQPGTQLENMRMPRPNTSPERAVQMRNDSGRADAWSRGFSAALDYLEALDTGSCLPSPRNPYEGVR